MNKTELIDFFHKHFSYRKGDLNTIKKITEAAETQGYKLIKLGVDNYELHEKSIILDYTKPLKFIKDLPSNSVFDCYKGLSRKHINTNPLWFFIINQEDGKILSLPFLAESLNTTIEEIMYSLDLMSIDGQLIETDKNLEFHFYPIKRRQEDIPSYLFITKNLPRQAPYKY